MKKATIYILVLILFSNFGTVQFSISLEARKYIDEVIEILKRNSINRKNIVWKEFRNKIVMHAKKAKTIKDTYASITYAITELGDHHSYFAPNIIVEPDTSVKELPVLKDEIVPNNIGYIRIPFCIGNIEQRKNYINAIITKIKERDTGGLKGWIVDLRENFGGNMWPMLVAVGSILGEGNVGYFIDPDKNIETWKYKKGSAFLDDIIREETSDYYSLKNPNPYVAVLTDSLTASSGEAITVAFKGRNKTKSFGTKTYGVATGNQPYHLSDNSIINLTTSYFADRNKNLYEKGIKPDKKCDSKSALIEAISWLNDTTIHSK